MAITSVSSAIHNSLRSMGCIILATSIAPDGSLDYNYRGQNTGEWPSGKALGSGPRIGGSNPSSPAIF
jgi:hypothetical protein